MASHYFGTNRGKGLAPKDVTTGTSASASDVEIRITDGVNLTKLDVTKSIERLLVFFNSRQNTTLPPL